MYKNSIDSKVFTYINGSLPFDVTMKKTSNNTYNMEKRGQTIYTFSVDTKGFVTEMSYPDYDLVLRLDTKDSDKTLLNKKYLKEFKEENYIKLIKE